MGKSLGARFLWPTVYSDLRCRWKRCWVV